MNNIGFVKTASSKMGSWEMFDERSIKTPSIPQTCGYNMYVPNKNWTSRVSSLLVNLPKSYLFWFILVQKRNVPNSIFCSMIMFLFYPFEYSMQLRLIVTLNVIRIRFSFLRFFYCIKYDLIKISLFFAIKVFFYLAKFVKKNN